MVETQLPAACWIVVTAIAAFTAWMCLRVIATAVSYDQRRRQLARDVRALRKRYSMSYRDVILGDDVVNRMAARDRAA